MKKRTLPLLDFVSDKYLDVKLDKVLLIASQHILESQRLMFQYFIEKGLKPENMFVIGKCYSTSREVLVRLKKMGIYVSPKSEAFDPYLSFDQQFEDYTKELLEYVKKKVDFKKFERIIILEDGGSLLSHANKILENHDKIRGIEQTSAGYEKLKNIKLEFPVINVARSYAKLEVESPIIAKTCVERLTNLLKNFKLQPKSILIVGAGAVGSAMYCKLKNNFDVKKYDLNAKLSDYKEESLKSILGSFDLVIGSTGKEIIDLSLYQYLKKDVILASVSSSDREFSSVNLRKMQKKVTDCHELIYADKKYLLNCGFPVNFDGKEDSSSPNEIQITLSLLFSAVCLATKKAYKKGLVDLEEDIQKLLVKEFKALC